jgi:hypothetical protein
MNESILYGYELKKSNNALTAPVSASLFHLPTAFFLSLDSAIKSGPIKK